jgi:metal binding Ada-like protein
VPTQGEDPLGASDGLRTYTLLGPDRQCYRSAQPGTLGGHRGTRIYGRLDCPAALRAIARGGYVRHRVFFRDEESAVAAGYRPCAVCCPEQYRTFKSSRTTLSEPDSSSA